MVSSPPWRATSRSRSARSDKSGASVLLSAFTTSTCSGDNCDILGFQLLFFPRIATVRNLDALGTHDCIQRTHAVNK